MREITETYKVYTYESASPELKEKIREYFAMSDSYGDWILEERMETLKAFAQYIGAELDYSVSLVPDRGEFIKVKFYGEHIPYRIKDLLNDPKACPLTGECYDEDLRDFFKENEVTEENLQYCLDNYLTLIHNDYECLLSDDVIKEHCEANEYEFKEDGTLY